MYDNSSGLGAGLYLVISRILGLFHYSIGCENIESIPANVVSIDDRR
jgi:hypothetical protein